MFLKGFCCDTPGLGKGKLAPRVALALLMELVMEAICCNGDTIPGAGNKVKAN